MSQLDGALNECIKSIADAANNSRQWLPALKEVQKLLPGSAISWAEHDFTTQSGSLIHTLGYEPKYTRLYAEKYSALNVWLQVDEGYQPGMISTGEELISNAKLLASKFYQEWLVPQDFHHRLCAVIKREQGRIFYLEALRATANGPYSIADKQLLDEIVPHLVSALQQNHYLWQLAIIKDIIEHLPYAIMVVDKHRQCLLSNHLAASLMVHESRSLYLNDNKLCAAKHEIDSKLNQAIREVASALPSQAPELSDMISISRDNDLLPLWLFVSPLRRKLRRVIGQECEVALIFIVAPEQFGEMPRIIPKSLYGLTNAEERLLHLILKGYPLIQAAKRLGITQNTARTHMKHIYAKTGTERQVDLVRLLLRVTVLPISAETTFAN